MSKVACASCGALNVEVARFCNHCGKLVSDAPAALGAVDGVTSPRAQKECPGCHKLNAPAAAFCEDCGVKLPTQASVPAHGPPAGFWIRAGALLLDVIVTAIAFSFLQQRLGIQDPPDDAPPAARLPILLLSVAFSLAYDTVMVGGWGASLGKMIVGIKVVRASGAGRPTFGLAFVRSFAQLLSALPLGLGFVWVALAPTKRAWHDYFADTRVVYKRPR
jgi:uncharacterized RDD family membrane protein YckC